MKSSGTFLALLFLVSSLVTAPASYGYGEYTGKDRENRLLAAKFQRDLEAKEFGQRLVMTLDSLIAKADRELGKRGYKLEAGEIVDAYETEHRAVFFAMKPGLRGIGDHEAIAWLLAVHDKIESVIGKKICEATRLHDLYWLAYTIPVVFRCVDAVTFPDYSEHFSKFCGIVAYWSVDLSCMIATAGAGVAMVCGLAAKGVEVIVVKWVAPVMDDWAWNLACKK